MHSVVQVIGIIDVTREKEKGYGTIVKEGFCEEVRYILVDILSLVCWIMYIGFFWIYCIASDFNFPILEYSLICLIVFGLMLVMHFTKLQTLCLNERSAATYYNMHVRCSY